MESIYRFQGFSGLSDIIGNFSTNKWTIMTYNSTYDISNEAGYLSDVSKFPIGTNTWLFHTGEQLPIKISKVNIYIYKSLGPRKKNPQQKKERAAESFFNKIKHQTS
jgi:hypothetical protein